MHLLRRKTAASARGYQVRSAFLGVSFASLTLVAGASSALIVVRPLLA